MQPQRGYHTYGTSCWCSCLLVLLLLLLLLLLRTIAPNPRFSVHITRCACQSARSHKHGGSMYMYSPRYLVPSKPNQAKRQGKAKQGKAKQVNAKQQSQAKQTQANPSKARHSQAKPSRAKRNPIISVRPTLAPKEQSASSSGRFRQQANGRTNQRTASSSK